MCKYHLKCTDIILMYIAFETFLSGLEIHCCLDLTSKRRIHFRSYIKRWIHFRSEIKREVQKCRQVLRDSSLAGWPHRPWKVTKSVRRGYKTTSRKRSFQLKMICEDIFSRYSFVFHLYLFIIFTMLLQIYTLNGTRFVILF